MRWRSDSLEAGIKVAFGACLLIQLTACGLLLMVLPLWQVALLALLLCILLGLLFRRLYRKVLQVFRRLGVQLDALQIQDYSLFAKPVFNSGRVAEFQRQLNQLGGALQQDKSRYDQQLLLLYRLIDQLNTPILIFDQKLQLSYANGAFATLFERPWQTLRHASPALLGLSDTPHWRFTDPHRAQRWQIHHSHFLDQGQSHQLLVFTNIQAALRENQLQAWQKLTRVLSHEIRNSLTPVAALVQNLQQRIDGEREQQSLELIGERCQHLQDFVSRYAQLHKQLNVQPQWLEAKQLFRRLADLFPDSQLRASGLHLQLYADGVLLQQVLINLIRNALEAGSPAGSIRLQFSEREQYSGIRLRDRGRGIANPDNLFVPFYSTKPDGQGIGLSLSRHIVEQMGGQLSLDNNSPSPHSSDSEGKNCGACALIRLPRPAKGPSDIG